MAKKWIQNAIKHPGAFTAQAKKAGAMTDKGTIKQSYVDKEKKSGNSVTKKRANLAATLAGLNKKK